MISLVEVEKKYGSEQALKKVSLEIFSGEIVGILGKSGSGKSTLLRLLNLMEPVTSGEILMAGQAVSGFSKKENQQKRQKIGMVFQQFQLLNNLTVFDNVMLPLKLRGKKDRQKVSQLLDFVGLSDKAQSYPSQLSGGEKQRVAIARGLVGEPELLLCDEVTSSLDEGTKQEVLRLLTTIHEKFQTTIVFVSHELKSVKQLCQRVIVMEAGAVLGEFSHQPVMKQGEASYYETVKRSFAE